MCIRYFGKIWQSMLPEEMRLAGEWVKDAESYQPGHYEDAGKPGYTTIT
jgi:hypothetical protein